MWKCHNETPCVAILYQQRCLFKNREQEGKSGPIWGLVPVGEEGSKERVLEGECGGNSMYSCMKKEK
jgi:hypothetical protein